MGTTTDPSSTARRLDASAIDRVLSDAVASGAVPHVAAVVADRDGIVYEGAAGPRAVDRTTRSPSTRGSDSCP